MEPISHPKWLYHQDGKRSCVVETPAQEAALKAAEEGWVDAPVPAPEARAHRPRPAHGSNVHPPVEGPDGEFIVDTSSVDPDPDADDLGEVTGAETAGVPAKAPKKNGKKKS